MSATFFPDYLLYNSEVKVVFIYLKISTSLNSIYKNVLKIALNIQQLKNNFILLQFLKPRNVPNLLIEELIHNFRSKTREISFI